MAANGYLQLKCLDNTPRLEVVVPNRLSVLLEGEGREVRGSLMQTFALYQRQIEDDVVGISEQKENVRFGTQLALEEILANITKHGKGTASLEWGKPINDPSIAYLIRARDEGSGFDPRSIPEPTIDYEGNTEEGIQRPTGRGMQLIDYFSKKIGATLALIPADEQKPEGKRNGFELRFRTADSAQKRE